MKLVHGFFGFSKESLKGEFFFFQLFWFLRTERFDFFFFHRVYRVISGTRSSSPSFTDLYRVLPNSMLISYLVSVSMRLGQHIGLGRFFEPWSDDDK